MVNGSRSESEPVTWVTDELGQAALIRVDTSVYSKAALFKTAYWYTNRCYLFLSPSGEPEIIQVQVRPKTQIGLDQLELLCREFYNSLLDYHVRQLVITETGPIRELLIRKAFFEGKRQPDKSILESDESSLPSQGQSYTEDPKDVGRVTGL